MMPGISKSQKQLAENNINEKIFNNQIAIIDSITKKERANPDLIKASRKIRISKGSGTKVQEVKQNELDVNLETLAELKRKQIEVEMLFNDWNNKDECVEHLENELKYAYKNGFTTELISNVESDANNISFGRVDEKINDNFLFSL